MTAHILAYSTHVCKTILTGDHLHQLFEYFSCALSFLCPLLPSCSGYTFCHPAEQARLRHHCVLEVSEKQTTKKHNQLLQFKLAFLAATDYQFLHKQPAGLEGGDKTVLSQLGGKTPGLTFPVSCKYMACISTPALVQY